MLRIAIPASFLVALVGCALSHERAGVAAEPQIASSASLAIDDTSLYWADPGRGTIARAPRGGGPVTVLGEASPALYAPIVVTSASVFWVDDREGIEVWRVGADGGAPRRVVEGDGGPIGIAADAEHLYYSRLRSAFDLLDVELATGTEHVVAPGTAALGLVLDGDELIGTSCDPDGVWRVDRAGGARRVIADAYCPITLALHDGDVYFSDYAEPTNPGVGGIGIFRASSAGGGATTRVTLAETIAFAVHRGFVYTAQGGSIVQVARDGSTVEIAPAEDVRGVAVDDDFVYFTEGSPDGAVDLSLAPLP